MYFEVCCCLPRCLRVERSKRFAIPCPVYELQYWYHKSEYHKSFTVFIVWFAMVSHLNVSHLLMVMSDFSSRIICNQKYRAVDAPVRKCRSELLANPNNGELPPNRKPQASSLPRRLDLANDLQSHPLYSIRLWRCCITKRRTWERTGHALQTPGQIAVTQPRQILWSGAEDDPD